MSNPELSGIDVPVALPPPRRRHPCFQWCGQRLIGIAESGWRSQGRQGPGFELMCRRPAFPGPDCYTFRCQHGREYFMRPAKE